MNSVAILTYFVMFHNNLYKEPFTVGGFFDLRTWASRRLKGINLTKILKTKMFGFTMGKNITACFVRPREV